MKNGKQFDNYKLKWSALEERVTSGNTHINFPNFVILRI